MSVPSTCADCPFCAIAAACPPSTPANLFPSTSPSQGFSSPPQLTSSASNPSSPRLAHILLSTPQLIAFLDHAPISRGHVLVATRDHREKLSEVSISEGMALGKWLGVVSRAVMAAANDRENSGVGGEANAATGEENVGDWNVVQNNGARAAQVVPHVHFHIIPRVGDVPEVKARSWTIFGKGQREDLDECDAEVLLGRMRTALGVEVERVRWREGEEAMRLLLGKEVSTKGKTNKL